MWGIVGWELRLQVVVTSPVDDCGRWGRVEVSMLEYKVDGGRKPGRV